jgi:hypothetical protein
MVTVTVTVMGTLYGVAACPVVNGPIVNYAVRMVTVTIMVTEYLFWCVCAHHTRLPHELPHLILSFIITLSHKYALLLLQP